MEKNIVYLIGKNTKKSLSPKIFNNLFKKLNLNYKYKAIDLKEKDFKNFILKVKKEKILFFNITNPYKEKILKYLNKIDKYAQKINAVNLVINKNNKLLGFNTDYIGFKKSLKHIKKTNLKNILLLGAGGVAKAICYALKNKKIFVYNRTKSKIKDLQNINKNVISLSSLIKIKFNLIINATSTKKFSKDFLNKFINNTNKKTIFYDIQYNKNNDFKKYALKNKLKFIDGKKMLYYQIKENFKKVFNIKI